MRNVTVPIAERLAAARPVGRSASERTVGCWLCSGSRLSTMLRAPLQGAVDRCHGRLQRFRHLEGREAEHLAEDEDRALSRRQLLERGDEGELDGLALL